MEVSQVEEAVELLEKANADLEPELLSALAARRLLAAYARAGKLAAFGLATLTRKLDDASELASITGTSVGKARAVVETGKVLGASGELSAALEHGDVSLDQATEIASAEQSAPGAAAELVAVARTNPFHVLREKARKVKLEAEQHSDLAARQQRGSVRPKPRRRARHNPHRPRVGATRRRPDRSPGRGRGLAPGKKGPDTRGEGALEAHLADAYEALLAGSGKGRARRPELVVLVSHEVAKRGWTDVRAGGSARFPALRRFRHRSPRRSPRTPS